MMPERLILQFQEFPLASAYIFQFELVVRSLYSLALDHLLRLQFQADSGYKPLCSYQTQGQKSIIQVYIPVFSTCCITHEWFLTKHTFFIHLQ